jgi:adenosylcobinamide-phosphate synthase
MRRGQVMVLALALDALGELPTPLHPVGWMGSGLGALRRRWRATSAAGQFAQGALCWSVMAGLTYGAGRLLGGRHWLLDGALLSTLLARRGLEEAVVQVETALNAGDLPGARRLLSWHLVSRRTAELSAAEVAAAALESLAENLSDSVIAPLVFYRLGGLKWAALYRLANTADAMWGYRTPELECSGRWAARADDVLNLLPARLSAGLSVLAAGLLADGRGAFRVWSRDAHRTSSPNAGHPMSAFAGALGLRLEKRGVYELNAGGRAVEAADLARARQLFRLSCLLGAALLSLGSVRNA